MEDGNMVPFEQPIAFIGVASVSLSFLGQYFAFADVNGEADRFFCAALGNFVGTADSRHA